MRALVIINPTAGAGRAGRRWRAVAEQLRSGGFVAETVFTGAPGEACNQARKAADHFDLLVAAGGDGTVSEVAEGILASPTGRAALAVLPLGTGNDFACSLGVASELESIRGFRAGVMKAIDAIAIDCLVNGKRSQRHALLFAGVGIISESLRLTTRLVKAVFGQRFAYPVGLVRSLWTYRSPTMRVQSDASGFRERFLFVGASNTPIAGGGMRIAPGADLQDAHFNVNLIGAVPRLQAFLQLRRLSRGEHLDHPNVCYFPARTLAVDADAPLDIAADGELVGQTPARFFIRPKALRVFLPEPRLA